MRALESVHSLWQPSTFVHNDLRFDNCLLIGDFATATVKIVDWELAGLGDPAWDLGCVFADYLAAWVASMDIVPGPTPDRLARTAKLPFPRVHKAVRTFWCEYVTTRGVDVRPANALLDAAIRFTGARLLQIAYEQNVGRMSTAARTILLVQLASNILVSPDRALESFFNGEADPHH